MIILVESLLHVGHGESLKELLDHHAIIPNVPSLLQVELFGFTRATSKPSKERKHV